MTISAVRVPQKSYVFVDKVLVDKHDRVAPDTPLIEAIFPDGVTTIITSEGWGTIEHITAADTLLAGGDIIYDIGNDITASVKGQAGLQIKPSTYMRWLKMGQPPI